jgi:catechol 2,3-dioxygenase-like lactoylglutathione lyase family enzyme
MQRLIFCAALLGLFAISARVIQVQTPNPAHFHHVHLNVTDPQKTTQFYQQVFGAQPVKFANLSDGLFTGRGFIFMNKVASRPRDLETTAIRHIGWAGVDGPHEFEWWKAQGIDFHTPLTPLGQNWFFYVYGPDREIAEVFTGDKNHWFNHVHFSATDVTATATWLERNLGMQFPATAKQPRPTDPAARWGSGARMDGVSFVLIYKDHYYADSERKLAVGRTLEPTRGTTVDHIAFSYENITPVFDRMKAAGENIVEPITNRPEQGFKSFMVMGPDNVLMEIVEAKPIPDGLWR